MSSASPSPSEPSEPETSAAPATDDPRRHAARIERLLADVRAMVGPVAWPRIEELVARLVAMYGAALGRLLVLVGEGGGLDERLRARVTGDELVSGLLALHGIHPMPALERVRGAAERVRRALGAGAGAIDCEVDAHDVARLRLHGRWRCAVTRAMVDEALRGAVEEAAPDVAAVEISGVDWTAPEPAAPGPGLVQIDLGRSRADGDPKRAP